jgi:hypothetical protein
MRKSLLILGMVSIAAIIILSVVILSVPSEEVKFALNEPFSLKIGQYAAIQSDNIKVTLVNVTEDSRCPNGVQCIWAGQVGVLVTVDKDGERLGDFKLISNQQNSTAVFGNYRIRLEKVEPYPIYGKKIEPENYLAEFIIYKI